MKSKFLVLTVFVLFFSISVYSQNLVDDNSNLIENYFNSIQHLNIKTPEEIVLTNSNLGSDITIIQEGNYNSSYILANSKSKQTLNQIGDHNNYEYYSFYNSNLSTVNTLQNGSNNDIQIFGQNELAKSINIIQNTNNKTLIIKNY